MSQQAGGFIIKSYFAVPNVPHANKKCFLLVHSQTKDVQPCFTVLSHAFLIGFPIAISKPRILSWILVKSLETINKVCTLHLSLKPDACSSSVTIVKSMTHRKKCQNYSNTSIRQQQWKCVVKVRRRGRQQAEE